MSSARALLRSAGPSVLSVALLAGCSAAQRAPAPVPADPSAACVGSVEAHDELAPVEDSTLLARALGAPLHGGLCLGGTYEVRRPLRVYRVWDSARPTSEHGRWWSLVRPEGPAARYREQAEICPEWSALNRVTACTLRVGVHVALGPGQSARCNGGVAYGPSAANQVYVHNDVGSLLVEQCEASAAWP